MIMNAEQTFSDRVKLKALATSFVAYVVLSVVLFAIVVQFWMPAGVSAERLRELAETDRNLLLWQMILGAVLTIVAGYIATRMSGKKGLRNSLAVGGVLTLYGVLGIYLHPSHPVIVQVAKLVVPIPLALIGGWVALRAKSSPPKIGDHA